MTDEVKKALRERFAALGAEGNVVPLRKPIEAEVEPRFSQTRILRVKMKSSTVAEMDMFGVVGGDFYGDGITQGDVAKELKAIPATVNQIDLRLSSPGGDAFEGRAIANMLKEHKASVNVNIISEASSAASIIAMAGDYIKMGEGAVMLVHRCYTMMVGNCVEMRSLANDLELIDNQAIDTYAAKTGMSKADVASLMDENRYMGPAECKKLGFVDEVADNAKQEGQYKIAAFDRNRLRLPPLPTDGEARAKAQNYIDRIRIAAKGVSRAV